MSVCVDLSITSLLGCCWLLALRLFLSRLLVIIASSATRVDDHRGHAGLRILYITTVSNTVQNTSLPRPPAGCKKSTTMSMLILR